MQKDRKEVLNMYVNQMLSLMGLQSDSSKVLFLTGPQRCPPLPPFQTCIAQLYQQSYQLRVSGSKNFHPLQGLSSWIKNQSDMRHTGENKI